MARRKPKPRKRKTSNKNPALEPTSSSSVPPPPWIELPGDVTADILRRLGTAEMLESAQKVCTTWWKVCQDPALYRVINLGNPEDFEDAYSMMCRRAVDLSRGQLIDLSIECFGDEELIHYIANRSSNLKRLTLRGCYEIYGEYLTQAVEKLPKLEELHLKDMTSVWAGDVRTIGLACPNLKSFSYNNSGSNHIHTKGMDFDDIIDDSSLYDYGPAISKSMHNLHHLRLFALSISNECLEAILDACPHLESLDLELCHGLDLSGDLGKRCREQVRDLRLPSDTTGDKQYLVDGPCGWDDNCLGIYDDQSIEGLSDSYYDYDSDDFDEFMMMTTSPPLVLEGLEAVLDRSLLLE